MCVCVCLCVCVCGLMADVCFMYRYNRYACVYINSYIYGASCIYKCVSR